MKETPKHLEVGVLGEKIALHFLRSHQFEILEQNFRYKKSEIDIIYKHKNYLGFVEVKTRTSSHFTLAETAIDTKKQQKMYEAAQAYCILKNHTQSIKFDIVIVEILPNNKSIYFYPDSFFPMPAINTTSFEEF